MSANFIEELVTEYYKVRGYVATPNYWFPVTTERQRTRNGVSQTYQSRSWSDFDVLAIGETDLVIVQVKAIVNARGDADKIISFFSQAEQFLADGHAPDQQNSIHWWTQGRAIRKILVYEYYSPPSYLKPIEDSGVEVVKFDTYFNELAEYISQKKGVKEENALMRMLHYLQVNNRLSPNDD